jgi:integrase
LAPIQDFIHKTKMGLVRGLRHTYATVPRRGGASVDDIREELGQVDSSMTRRYIGSLESEQTRSNAKQLEAFKKRDKHWRSSLIENIHYKNFGS